MIEPRPVVAPGGVQPLANRIGKDIAMIRHNRNRLLMMPVLGAGPTAQHDAIIQATGVIKNYDTGTTKV